MRTRRNCAALLVAAFALAACQGGTTTHMTPSTVPAGKGHSKPNTVVSNQCVPPAGQSVGTITEYTVPGTNVQPFGITADQNGYIWFAEWNAGKIGKFNISSHAFNSYATPTQPSSPIRITIGPDGNPWTAEVAPSAGKIAKFNLSTSTFTEYSAYGGANSEPEWLDVAPAGTANAGLWVSLYQETRLDNITTSGAQTLHVSQSGPYGLSSDTQGNIWYTTLTGNKIGVQRTDGTTGSWTIPTGSSGPYGITEGPTGTGMWFAESTGNKIGNISASGSFTEYSIPTTTSHPTEVVAACGNIWFTEYLGNKIGELNPQTGSFSEFSVPTASSEPTGVAVDANGNVWFTERAGNKIAEITTVGSASPAPDGAIYVLNSTGGSVVNYTAGNFVPPPAGILTSFPGAGPSTDAGMAFDSSGDLWIAGNGYVAEYAPGASGSATPIKTFMPADSDGRAIAIDSAGEILLADPAANAIYAYAASSSGSATPIRTISGSSTGLSSPYRIVLDSSGNIWIANATVPSVVSFPTSASGNVVPALDLDSTWASNNGIANMDSLAIDHSGNLIVLANNGQNVFRFAPGVSESSLYASEFNPHLNGGSSASLSDLAVDDEGYVYGTLISPSGVLIYPPSVTGNAVPYVAITASNDGLQPDPLSIAVWSNAAWWYGGDARHTVKRLKPHR
jgi:streptogramin lyase